MPTSELPRSAPSADGPAQPPALEVEEPSPIRQERAVLRDLIQLAAERARAEAQAEAAFQSRNEQAEKTFQETRERLRVDFERETRETQERFEQTREAIAKRYETEHTAAAKQHGEDQRGVSTRYYADKESLRTEIEEARWTIHTVHEAGRTKSEDRVRQAKTELGAYLQKIESVGEQAAILCEPWLRTLPPPAQAPGRFKGTYDTLVADLDQRLNGAEARLAEIRRLSMPRYVQGYRLYAAIFVVWVLALLPGIFIADIRLYLLGGGVVLAAVVTGVGYAWLLRAAQAQVASTYGPLCQMLAEAKALCRACGKVAKLNHRRELERNQQKHDVSLSQTEKKHERATAELEERRGSEGREVEEAYKRNLEEITELRDSDARDAEEKFPARLAELKRSYEYDDAQATERYHRQMADSARIHEEDWIALIARWREGLERARAAAAEINDEVDRLFPAWNTPFWNDWKPPTAIPPVIRFGDFEVRMDRIPEGVSQSERLKDAGPQSFPLPVLLPLSQKGSLLFRAGADGRTEAEHAIQMVMFRLLSALPPGKVRFAIVDPVGLGQNFAAFMHLADDDEQLVTNRIWTESSHIEQRLTDLTAHMENVIQRCLRNQFRNIEEYNAQAGEVAEPFRFLVVANFPANFTIEASRRLLSIASSGARCGVHTLVTVDTRLSLPQGFDLRDLERHGVNLVWDRGGYAWKDADFSPFPFRLDPPPEAHFMTRLLQSIGRLAKEASRVEVPFSWVAPEPDKWWTNDTRGGVHVPLGRVGATKRQFMDLGQGTSQHVLIAGKTGSGKSTLMHALITNTALAYSPQEIELYLVDFKEGVEFKDYASYELPHARVVAIESEREFGLSVLQRLDAELRLRGEKFRAMGVQELASYREASGEPMPRVLLIVDEFQLFFIDDDKIAQDAALLLDRLVRQGRAFGIHVLLGSQTLGGAYSLARSTIGQMAVRIALQCSESDAHMILSDDNPAARLLSRPGEAIYNDANGLVEGNDFFQVVWLPDDLRESYLARIRDLARERGMMPRVPQIVFEGKAPADVRKNHLLNELLAAPAWPTGRRVAQAWLGEAMAIKDPTAADFRPQSGGNMLIVGQYDESALATAAMSVISLAAQLPPPGAAGGGTRFYILDGTPPDDPNAGFLGKLPEVIPHAVQVVGWRDLAGVLDELAAEVARRQEARDGESAPLFLFVHGLQRFRELRRAEDDYSFSRQAEEKPTPGKQFGTIVREGPGVGVHVVVWCDSLNNVNRAFERQMLREFEMRMAFQMSAADSSNLIDSPLASKLGAHRAFFYSEERGHPEKFRPYALPSPEWLAEVKGQLSGRSPLQEPAKT